MVVVFFGWLTALVNRQSILFLCEQIYDKVDNEIFSQYSTKLILLCPELIAIVTVFSLD